MNDVRGGFTEHDRYLGFRASCRCGWVGPWRGMWLTKVESDVIEHRPNGCTMGPHTRMTPATRKRPGVWPTQGVDVTNNSQRTDLLSGGGH